jgi:hypothetical protein
MPKTMPDLCLGVPMFCLRPVDVRRVDMYLCSHTLSGILSIVDLQWGGTN